MMLIKNKINVFDDPEYTECVIEETLKKFKLTKEQFNVIVFIIFIKSKVVKLK